LKPHARQMPRRQRGSVPALQATPEYA